MTYYVPKYLKEETLASNNLQILQLSRNPTTSSSFFRPSSSAPCTFLHHATLDTHGLGQASFGFRLLLVSYVLVAYRACPVGKLGLMMRAFWFRLL